MADRRTTDHKLEDVIAWLDTRQGNPDRPPTSDFMTVRETLDEVRKDVSMSVDLKMENEQLRAQNMHFRAASRVIVESLDGAWWIAATDAYRQLEILIDDEPDLVGPEPF